MDPAVSPDGKWVAFTSNRNGQYDIYLIDINGKNLRRLTRTKEADLSPRWFPDCKRLIFTVQKPERVALYTISRDGGDPKPLELPEEFEKKSCGYPAVSPDGKRIAFIAGAGDGTTYEIYIREKKGTVKQITQNKVFDGSPGWSPNGKKLAFVSNRDNGNGEIYVTDRQGKKVKRLTDNNFMDTMPRWSANGRNIIFISSRDRKKEGIADVYIMKANGKKQTNLTKHPAKDLGACYVKKAKRKKK